MAADAAPRPVCRHRLWMGCCRRCRIVAYLHELVDEMNEADRARLARTGRR